MRRRLTALLVAVVFVFGTAVMPSQIYAVESETQQAEAGTLTEESSEARENSATDETANNPAAQTGEYEAGDSVQNPGEESGSDVTGENTTETSTEESADLSDLIVVTDENGDNIDIEELDEEQYDGFIYKIKDDTTKSEIKEMEKAIDELDEEQEVQEVIDKELYAADSVETISEVAPVEQIEHIEPNYILKATGTSDKYYNSYGWYLEMTNVPYIWDNSMFGEGSRVAVIDSGVNTSHEDLIDVDYDASYNSINESSSIDDDSGHGTAVTGVIAAAYNNKKGLTGIMPGATIIPVKALYYDEEEEETVGTTSSVIKGIEHAIDNKADVVNLSMGTYFYSAELYNACKNAAAKGLIMVAAAGNEAYKGNPIEYPASFDCVVSVGSVANNGTWSSFSNYNNSLAVTAPGEYICAPTSDGNSSYCIYSGTSFAAPQVSAMAAMIKSMAKVNGESVNYAGFMDVLAATAVDKGTIGYDPYYGYGLIDFSKAYRYMEGDLTLCGVSLSGSTFTYDGKTKTPSVSVRWLGRTLAASNYSTTYSSGRAAVGTYKITVAGKGSFVSSKTLSFNIVPPLVKKIKSPVRAKKKLTVRWKAMSKKQKKKYKSAITGYQVRVSTNSSFTNAKYVKVKGIAKTKATVKGLKRKTYYYIQYRSYKNVGSAVYYSKWSGTKKARTK